MKSFRASFALLLMLVLSLFGCGACGGSPGTLAAARPDATFVKEAGAMFVMTQAGIERVAFDGSARKVVFARPGTMSSVGTSMQWHVLDISADFATWVLGDDDTNVFVGDMATGAVREVKAAARRASGATLSPDGKRLAIARHSDFSVKGAKDDDTLYVVDVASLATTTLGPTTDHWPSKITWSADAKALWVEMNFGTPSQWVTLPDPQGGAAEKRESGLSAPPAALGPPSPLRRPVACKKGVEADRWEPVVRVLDPPAAPLVVAHIDGRKRGFHDYVPDFSEVTWTPSCGYVMFAYEGSVWAVKGDGSVGPGPVVQGSRIVFAP